MDKHRRCRLSRQSIKKKTKQSALTQSKKRILSSNKKKENRCKLGSTQCIECSEWYSNNAIDIHTSQCSFLRQGFAMDIGNRNDILESLQNGPTYFLGNARVDIKCTKCGERAEHDDGGTLSIDEGINAKKNQQQLESWKMFEDKCTILGGETVLSLSDIPFPKVDSTDFVSLGLGRDVPIAEKKVKIREMLIRWHPDHFIQRFRTAFRTEDIPMIELRLNEIIRIVSALKKTCPDGEYLL